MSHTVSSQLLLLWKEFTAYWYSNRLGQYRDDPVEPTITDFMDWMEERLQ